MSKILILRLIYLKGSSVHFINKIAFIGSFKHRENNRYIISRVPEYFLVGLGFKRWGPFLEIFVADFQQFLPHFAIIYQLFLSTFIYARIFKDPRRVLIKQSVTFITRCRSDPTEDLKQAVSNYNYCIKIHKFNGI